MNDYPGFNKRRKEYVNNIQKAKNQRTGYNCIIWFFGLLCLLALIGLFLYFMYGG